MGVPYYFYVITQQHSGILNKLCPDHVDYFYLDFNGGVHPVCHRLMANVNPDIPKELFEEKLCQESWNYMMSLVREVKPKETHVMLDGVAPVAKIQQQRKRRYLSILRQKMLKQYNLWDSNAISPGTSFMKKLNDYFREKKTHTFSPIPIHFSGSDEPGEGEHKIFHKMASNTQDTSSESYTPSTHVIYGLDADLIMLSLLSHTPRLFLMREQQNAKKQEEGYVYLDIDALRTGILKMLRQDYHWPISEDACKHTYHKESCRIIENYVVSCFLLGNDFLPNVTSIHLKKNGLYSILTTFQQTWEQVGHPLILQTDSPSDAFSLEFLSTWLEIMSKQEDDWIWKLNEDYLKKKSFIQSDEDKVENYPILPENKSPLAFEILKLSNKQKWRAQYYKYLLEAERQDMSVVVTACKEYIHGIMWTYCYYKQYKKPYDWYYPYGYAPTLRDMYNHLFAEMNSFHYTWKHWQTISLQESTRFIHPTVQLMAILPKESHHLLSETIVKKINTTTNGVRYMYPSVYPIMTYMKTHLWECHPRLPTLNIPALYKLL